eukprot:s2340_g25.t1
MAHLPTLLKPQPHDTKEELTRRFRLLAAQIHPDKNDSPEAHREFIELKEEFEDAVKKAQTEAHRNRLEELDKKAQNCVRKRKGWSISKSKKKQPKEKVLAIQDDLRPAAIPSSTLQDKATQATQTETDKGQGGMGEKLSRKQKHARWEQVMVLRKENHASMECGKEDMAAEKQAEKRKTIRHTAQRGKRGDFGYEAEACPSEIPAELLGRFILEKESSEEEGSQTEETPPEPQEESLTCWLVGILACCPCLAR